MKNLLIWASLSIICMSGCTSEKKTKDRSDANDMFFRICKLTKDYTVKLTEAPDSASWEDLTSEYEDRLEKINFSYPPDTDLLLTEGQNDTIHNLMMEYIKARDLRLNELLHPIVEVDSLSEIDSSMEIDSNLNEASASRSHDN